MNFKYIQLFIISALISFNSPILYSQNSLIVSPIGPQEIVAGGSMPIFYSAVNGKSDDVVFTSQNLPGFITMEEDGENAGRFIVNTSFSDTGSYDFELLANYNNQHATIPVHLEVIAPQGELFYCDPTIGDMNNSGDIDHPWSSLEDVFKTHQSFEPGDVIYLKNGNHGNPKLDGYNNNIVHIVAASNHKPSLSKLSCGVSKNWVITGLVISPETDGKTSNETYVDISFSAARITLQNCEIYGIKNSSVWTSNQDWYDNCGNGVICFGDACLIRNNYIYNTNFSVELHTEESKLLYNTIDRYAGDAVRGLANNTEYSYNVIKNPVVDDYETGNHDDAFQSWTKAFDPPKKNIKIIGNQIFNATHPDIPLLTRIMQGIINFDGFSEDWTIANNLIVTEHPHGITLIGAKNCKIVNNTVLKNPLNLFQFSSHPWISIWPTKATAGSVPSRGNLVRNNIMPNYSDAPVGETQGVGIPGSKDHNFISKNYTSIYVDYNHWDFRHKDGSSTINAGILEDAPYIDIEGNRREDGLIDLGCYEHSSSLKDIINPTAATNISATNINATSLELNWTDSYDLNGIAYYEIIYETTSSLTTPTSSVFIAGLRANTNYTFYVKPYDYFGNTSDPIGSITVKTAKNDLLEEVFVIPVDRFDQIVKDNKKFMWINTKELLIGGSYSSNNTVAILPFKLPRLREGKNVSSCELITNLRQVIGNPSDIDLYGISRRENADAIASDYWQGTFGTDPIHQGLIASYLKSNGTLGIQNMNIMEMEQLSNFLQSEYDNGAKFNDYIFFRLNSSITKENANSYYEISSSASQNSYERPILKVIMSDIDGVKRTKLERGLTIFPNPITHGNLNYDMTGFQDGEILKLYIHDISGKLIFKNNLVYKSTSSIKSIETSSFQSGHYFITILGQKHFAQSTIDILK